MSKLLFLTWARRSEKRGGDGEHLAATPALRPGGEAGFLAGLPVPIPQRGHRSEAGLGGIQSCVSCTFKAASEGTNASQFFRFRESACERAGGGENSELGGAALGFGPTKPPLPISWALAL